jgi:hypothetical protein
VGVRIESDTMQKRIPKMSCKNTTNEKVLNVLIFTQWAFAWMGKATPGRYICYLAVVMSNHTQEEPTLWGSMFSIYIHEVQS